MVKHSYSYPRDERSGRAWHMRFKVNELIGEMPESAISEDAIVLTFKVDLDTEEQVKLGSLMARPDLFEPSHAGYIDTAKQVLLIEDAFDNEKVFNEWIEKMGIPDLKAMYFAIGRTHMEVHFSRVLSQPERQDILKAAKNLMSWKA